MDLCSENNTIQSVVIKALSLLPYTELLNVACVCKSWCKLRTSKGFRDARKAVDEHALVVTNWTDDATYLSVYALCGDRWHKMAVNHAQAYGRSSRPLLVIGAATSFRGELFDYVRRCPSRALKLSASRSMGSCTCWAAFLCFGHITMQ